MDTSNPPYSGARLVVTRADQVQIKPISWLWPGRVAKRKQTLIAGEAGLGKSQVTIDIAARVTRGAAWPLDEGHAPIGTVIFLSAEDGVSDTIVPRLLAAGGDRSKVHIVRAALAVDNKQRSFSLAEDLGELEKLARDIGDVQLIVIDPISSYMGGKANSHNNTDVRSVLEPVGEMAERLDVAVVSITHPPKNTDGKAINAFMGSVAFVAAARAAFLVFRDREDPERRLFLNNKNNIAPIAAGLSFHLEQSEVAEGVATSRIVWGNGPINITADEAMRTQPDNPGALEAAIEFLREVLGPEPTPSAEIEKSAQELGIATRTLARARRKLGVRSRQEGGSWFMWLPGP